MKRHIELLLLITVENLGIVGDLVKVKPGYARNYLLPHGLAEFPTPEKIESLKEARARAQAEQSQVRGERQALIERLANVEVRLVRSANEQGGLYGSVTQRDISDALIEAGYGVDTRAVRLRNAIRHVGHYPVVVQFDKELRAEVTVHIESDQPLEEREEMDFDNEGNLIEKPASRRRPKPAEEPSEATA